MTKRLLFTLALALLTASGCNLIYKQSIQQGNALEQEDLDKLRIGMSMNQVSFLLGTPAIQDPFHHDRWDYVSTFSRRGDPAVMRKVTLYFENGALSEMIGVEGNEFIFEEEPVEEAPDEVPVATAAAMDEANDTLTENDSPGAEVTALESPQAEELPYEVSAAEVTPPTAAAEEAMSATRDEMPQEETGVVPTENPATELEQPLATSSGDGWVVQLGAFDSEENASRMLERLNAQGHPARLITQPSPSGTRYLVRQFDIESREAAVALVARIADELGINGFLVPPGE